jgi:hypothetical protein
MSMEQDFVSSAQDGDSRIEFAVDHRTLVLVKNHSQEVLAEICIFGEPVTKENVLHIGLAPGHARALVVYAHNPTEYVFVKSVPVSEYEKESLPERTRYELLRRPGDAG